MYLTQHETDERERRRVDPGSHLGIEIPVPCPLTQCERLMLDLCRARNDLRTTTTEKQRKQRELDDAQGKHDRLMCSRSKVPATAAKACQILTSKIATLTSEVSALETQRLGLRARFWSLRDDYLQMCGSLPSGFSKGKAVTLRKQGSGGTPCFWRQPC